MSDVEKMATEFHAVYQAEARRQGDVRHPDTYESLPENTKEYDRALARHVLAEIESLKGERDQLRQFRNKVREAVAFDKDGEVSNEFLLERIADGDSIDQLRQQLEEWRTEIAKVTGLGQAVTSKETADFIVEASNIIGKRNEQLEQAEAKCAEVGARLWDVCKASCEWCEEVDTRTFNYPFRPASLNDSGLWVHVQSSNHEEPCCAAPLQHLLQLLNEANPGQSVLDRLAKAEASNGLLRLAMTYPALCLHESEPDICDECRYEWETSIREALAASAEGEK